MSSSRKRSERRTQEEIEALQERRRLQKAKKQEDAEKQGNAVTLTPRRWQSIANQPDGEQFTVKIMTWNILSQSLIRRELFPYSDCLKLGHRIPLILAELERQTPDVLFLQEVNPLDKLAPFLESRGYAFEYASAPKKQHGCLVAFRKDLFEKVDSKTVLYDDYILREDTAQKANTFRTRNIGLIIALRSKSKPQCGFVGATTHLFWHPKYNYERTRQLSILIREIHAFRSDESWPCILAGDFNFEPLDAPYALITRQPLQPRHLEIIKLSSVIHTSLDPSVPKTVLVEDEEGEAPDPDKVLTSVRSATEADGLLSIAEIQDLFESLPQLHSAYSLGLSKIAEENEDILRGTTTQSRYDTVLPNPRARFEPAYTSYTHFWKNTLDYIFISDSGPKVQVTGLAIPYTREELGLGLPMNEISGSDHVCLVAEVQWKVETASGYM